MHSFLPFKHSRLRVYMPLFAALLLVLTPGMGAADPAPASPVPEVSTATPSVVQEALQAVVEQTAPETPAAPVVQTASALPAVSGEPGSALAKEGASVPLQAEWLLDPKGTHTLTDVLSPNAQKEFKPYEPESLPHQAGTIWMRLEVEGKAPAFPLVLDLNTRIAGQLPGIPQVWLVRPGESNGTPVRPSSDGLYSLPSPLPDQTGIYIRVNGIPAPGFAPMLRNAASLTLVDELGTQPQLVLLAVLLFLCLLRGVTERREWRMWAALYIAAVWVQAFWGLPTTPAGEVSRWDMPGLLAPGVALLILPHVGRHMLRTRHHAPFIDMQFVLLALFGIALSVAPLIPGYTWTLQFLPLWPLFMLLLLPGTLAACARRLPGAKRFLLICILPPLGMLALFPLSRLLPESLIGLLPHALDGFMTPGVVSLIPLTGLTLSALFAALSPSPKPLPAPNRSTRDTKTGRAGVAALELGGASKASETSFERLPSLSAEPEGLELANFPNKKPSSANVHSEPARAAEASRPTSRTPEKRPYPQALQAPLSAGMVEESLRAPLDALLRAISAVDQSQLSAEARRRTDALGVAGRNLATAIGNMGRGVSLSQDFDRKERFDLNQLLLETHEAVSSLAESKNLGLSWFTAPYLPRCYEGRRAQLANVLALLVESAVLATDRGMVQIRAQRLPESTDPGHLLFTVSDTGSGMPPLERSTLALVRTWELVGPDGELVSLESGPKGTTISFSMRLTARIEQQPIPAAPEPDKETLSRLPASSLRIIVASNVPANRQMLSYYLDELPHEIIEARSAEEAKALYRRTPGALIIFDDDMPEESIADAVADIRIFEGEHNFPLASILALVNSNEQIDALRRAGCTHFLKKPITRKDLRVLTLRLAPVSRRFKDTDGAPQKTAPKPQAPSAKGSPRVSPDIPNLPELPEPAKPLAPALSAPRDSHAAEPAPVKRGIFASLFARFRKQAKPAAPEAPTVVDQVDEPVMTLTEKAPEKPIKLSSVGEPMPISKASPEEAPAPRPRPERPNPLEERAKHMPAQSSAPTNAAEWVGEPMPITKKQDGDQGLAKQVEAPLEMPTQEKEAEKRPAPEHASAPQRSEAATPLNTVPDLNLDEWVGEPTPIIKPLPVSAPLPAPEEAPLTLEPEQKVSPKKRDNAPLTLAPADDAPLTLTAQTDKADEPLMLGTPLPDKKSSLSNDVLMLDEPLGNQPELSLAGLGLEPQAEVINLTEPVRKPTPAQPAEKDAPIPDLFGDARPAPQPGPRSLLDEAACLAPCGQGSRPTASTNELAIDDIVELGVPVAPVIQPATEKDIALPEPQEAPLPPVLPAGDGEAAAQEQPVPAIPETPEQEPALPTKDGQKGPLQDAEQESEASDEAIRALLTELDEALERAIQGEQSGDAQMVCQAAAHIGRLAETYDLRVLDDPARCLEEVACSGNMDEIVQLMPDLVSAINRNRASFEEAERDG